MLVGSAADTFAAEQGGPHVEVVRFDGATDAMTAVQNGQYDATLQDLPAARFYRDRFPGLELVGPPESHGYYVIYVGKDDEPLRDALDRGLARLIASGELRRLYEKYGIWTEAQNELATIRPARSSGRSRHAGAPRLGALAPVSVAAARCGARDHRALGHVDAAGDGAGALDRDRQALRAATAAVVLSGYVELIRGTPLMLQLFVLFYLLEAAALGRRHRRAGDQLFGLRGRDLPRGPASHSRRVRWRPPWPWACRGRWHCGG